MAPDASNIRAQIVVQNLTMSILHLTDTEWSLKTSVTKVWQKLTHKIKSVRSTLKGALRSLPKNFLQSLYALIESSGLLKSYCQLTLFNFRLKYFVLPFTALKSFEKKKIIKVGVNH